MMESNHMMESHHMALLIAEIHLCYSKLQNYGIASYDGNPSHDGSPSYDGVPSYYGYPQFYMIC